MEVIHMSDSLDYVATNLVIRSALLEESGATVSRYGNGTPTDGYYVGGAIKTLVVDSRSVIDFPTVREFIGRADTPYVGFWVDSETDKIHFDLVDWYRSERDALHLARVRGELAVWDIANETEVRL